MLRKSSHLILNLLLLMVDSNIPQLTGEKELLEVEKKLRLDLDDDRAGLLMRDLINESVNAFGPKFAEILHNVRKFYN